MYKIIDSGLSKITEYFDAVIREKPEGSTGSYFIWRDSQSSLVWEGQLECSNVQIDKSSIRSHSDLRRRYIKFRRGVHELFGGILQLE